jgi:hypothetical protein
MEGRPASLRDALASWTAAPEGSPKFLMPGLNCVTGVTAALDALLQTMAASPRLRLAGPDDDGEAVMVASWRESADEPGGRSPAKAATTVAITAIVARG